MTIWFMRRSNGDIALVRHNGKEYCADVTTHTGRNDNENWQETYKTASACRKELEKCGFRVV